MRPVLSVVATCAPRNTLGPFAGTIEPRYKTDLGFRIFGRMVARFVDVGSVVKKGEEIAVLDPAVQTLAVRSAEATVANAEAQFANAEAEEARQRDLVQRNITPQAQFDLIQRNRETAAGQPDARPRLAAQGPGRRSPSPSSTPTSTASSPAATPSRDRWSMPARRSSPSPGPRSARR